MRIGPLRIVACVIAKLRGIRTSPQTLNWAKTMPFATLPLTRSTNPNLGVIHRFVAVIDPTFTTKGSAAERA